MFGLESLSGSAQAVATVGVVFAEALVLYVGYGALSGALGSTVLDALGGD
ncbi:DUF7512 family protein [Haloarcula nitratireducens]|uniref:Uncharacterized protein n=1 Tax=Haloarcula nitratireducens TaxID=2487749 RepID=A0AAW4P648_9EURY|nr:hypothetical protein [Halomicroarcula nitratireducens]MBX0293304.1 hypothetical protein [Halomicroarcula nitratireducens]